MIERKLMIDAENGDEKSMYELGMYYLKITFSLFRFTGWKKVQKKATFPQ